MESIIAKGGMGSVYLVKDAKLNDKVWAVKEILQMDGSGRFQEEARLLTALSHPHIPKITDYFEPDAEGRCYLVMEYVNGTTLQQRFDGSSRKLPLPTIFKYMIQLCDILAYLHEQPQPIIFRDLKPANMMIDQHDNVQLIDFGIARSYDSTKMSDTVQMGTIAFASPEQFENKQTDQRTDIFSAGAVLYYLLTEGQFVYQNRGSIMDAMPHVPIPLARIVQRMLEPEPSRRYSSIRQAGEELRSVQQQLTEHTTSTIQPPVKPAAPVAAAVEEPVMRTVMIKSEDRPGAYGNTASLGGLAYGGAPAPALYTTKATQTHPALIIYLLDVSGSMSLTSGGKKRIDVVTESLGIALRQMVFRSTKGSRIAPRYRVAIITYSDEATDLLGGIKPIDELMSSGMVPQLSTHRFSDAAKAFLQAEKLLKAELSNIQDGPAPLICHMTDGIYTGEDPEPIAKRIMEMSVKDGNVLIQNIFMSDEVLEKEIDQPKRWGGVREGDTFRDEYGEKLMRMSSVLPESYRQTMQEANYSLAPGSLLMFPGAHPDLVALGFQMSAATPVR
ncbi:hypothetical protein PCURB6_12130 [Paenibacillus curdlanolyticus]|nr:hypothetical protein PCURB6_12130 [Paenibacillus curdlanolyticus]